MLYLVLVLEIAKLLVIWLMCWLHHLTGERAVLSSFLGPRCCRVAAEGRSSGKACLDMRMGISGA